MDFTIWVAKLQFRHPIIIACTKPATNVKEENLGQAACMDYRWVSLIGTLLTGLISCAVLVRDWMHDEKTKSQHYKRITVSAILLTALATIGSGLGNN